MEIQYKVLEQDAGSCNQAVLTCKGYWEERWYLVFNTDLKGIAPDFLTVPELRKAFVQLKFKTGGISLKGSPGNPITMWVTKSPWKIEKGSPMPVDTQYWLLLMLIHRFRREEFDRVATNLCKSHEIIGRECISRALGTMNIPGVPKLPAPAQHVNQFLGFWTVPIIGNCGDVRKYESDYCDDTSKYKTVAYRHGNIEFFKGVCKDSADALAFIGRRGGFCSMDEMSLHFSDFRKIAVAKANRMLVANSPECKWMFSGTAAQITEYVYELVKKTV